MSVLDYIKKAKKKNKKTTLAKGMKDGDTVVVDGRKIPVIKAESDELKRKPTKKEMQEDRAKNRPSRNITGDRGKQRKRKKLVRDMMTTGLLGAGLGRKFGVKNQFMQQQKPLGKVGKKTGDMILSSKADLDGDGMFSEYEKKRGMAVQKAMAENSKPTKVVKASQGGGIAIRGTNFKGVF
tara:strand:- start:2033 stop:2575 length:543 start_codon:yes stop_codon:yes gene_type:complete